MTREPTYQAARAVAATVAAHFAQHLSEARRRGERELAPAPDARTIEMIIDATFWASFRPEEGRFPQISLAFLPPEQAGRPLMLEQRLPVTPAILTKLAPAVERPGIHLGVWHDADELYIWGGTRVIPSLGFVVEDIEPGLLVIKHRRIDGFGKFANVAVLKGEQVKIVDEQGASLPNCPDLVESLQSFTAPATWDDSVNVMVQLAASMRAHGHGGTLLVVPAATEKWRESIVHPILYSVAPSFSRLAELIRKGPGEATETEWQSSTRRAVETIAGLTAVDGATVITNQYEVLAFGAKIRRSTGSDIVEQMMLTEAIVGDQAIVVPPAQHGGTRHLSAAQFIYNQRDALALVASQDGRFTVFAWSPCEEMVHAHRIDVLLL
jgi:DNA integrity scanning protein DisA with diadenylate cyclase activity